MQRAWSLLACMALATFVAACSSGSGSPASLTGKSPAEVLNAASAAATAVGSTHYVLTETAGNQTQTITGDATTTDGRQSITTGTVHVQVVLVHGVAYVQGSAGGLGAALGFSSNVAKAYAGRWIAVGSADSPYGSIVQAVTLNGTISELRPTGHLSLAGTAIIGGRSALGVKGGLPGQIPSGVSGSTTLYVASSRPTVPLKFTAHASRGSQTIDDVGTFTAWGKPVHLSAPAGSVAFSSIRSS